MPQKPTSCDVEYCFPRYGPKSDKILIDLLNHSKHTVDIAIFNFTDKNILKAILAAKGRGVKIRVITDKIMLLIAIQYMNFRKIKKAGISIKKNSHSGFMHLKMTITDKEIVTVASANFTNSSQTKNDDVFLVFRNDRIAEDFDKQFETMWNNVDEFTVF